MKALILFSLVASVARSHPFYHHTRTIRDTPPAPASYAPAPAYLPAIYDFNWSVLDSYSGNDFGQQESRNDAQASGSYYVALPDGRRQKVTYSVDGYGGYVAEVTYDGEAAYPEHAAPAYKPAPVAYKPAPPPPAPEAPAEPAEEPAPEAPAPVEPAAPAAPAAPVYTPAPVVYKPAPAVQYPVVTPAPPQYRRYSYVTKAPAPAPKEAPAPEAPEPEVPEDLDLDLRQSRAQEVSDDVVNDLPTEAPEVYEEVEPSTELPKAAASYYYRFY